MQTYTGQVSDLLTESPGRRAVSVSELNRQAKTLLERIPELAGIRDVTDHSDTTNAYYR